MSLYENFIDLKVGALFSTISGRVWQKSAPFYIQTEEFNAIGIGHNNGRRFFAPDTLVTQVVPERYRQQVSSVTESAEVVYFDFTRRRRASNN